MTELSPSLIDLIGQCIPTLDAARVLLHIAANRGRPISGAELATDLSTAVLSALAVGEYVAQFARCGIIVELHDTFRYTASTKLDALIRELQTCYDERPVTLVVTIAKVATGRVSA